MSESPPKPYRILVADDDPITLMLYRSALAAASAAAMASPEEGLGDSGTVSSESGSREVSGEPVAPFELVQCSRAEDAVYNVELAICMEQPFTVAFLDVLMPPGPDGVWAAERIRTLDRNLHIILVTALSDVNPEEIARRIPPRDKLLYVKKPLDPLELQSLAAAFGAKWRAERLVEEYQLSLEQRVARRTAELARVNEQLRSEIEERRRTSEQLRILESAIQTVDVGLTITDRDDRILFVNRREAEMHGCQPEELIGTSVWRFEHRSQPADGPLEEGVFRRESEGLRKDGSAFPVHLTSVPVHDQSGVLSGMITICEDLTARKQTEHALAEARKEATIGKLAAAVAHKVNTPLAAMKTRLGLLREDAEEFPEAIDSIDILEKQVDRIAQTVRALLGFARQRFAPSSMVLSLPKILRGVLALYEEHLGGKGIDLQVQVPDDLPKIMGSADEVQEVFINLFTNFHEALDSGNTINVSGGYRDGTVEICIEDDGPGLGASPEKVFEPFYTTKSSGTGLGLAIARKACEAMGGNLTGENRPPGDGAGARFTVSLPVYQPIEQGKVAS